MPSQQQRHLNPLLYHLIRISNLMALQSNDGRPLDVWNESRDELNAAFLGTPTNPEMAALVDVANEYQIPKEYVFAPLLGSDLWIRQHQFLTYDELEVFVGKVGGSLMVAMMPVLGTVKSGYEEIAYECGKGILLTGLLANLVNDARVNKVFLAQQDLQECEIDIQRIMVRKSCPTLKHLVRLYCWRIEKIFESGGQILSFLDFDSRRSMTSLLSLAWKTKLKMQMEPDSILNEEGVLNRRELFELRAKHLLGLEGDIPFAANDNHSEH